MLKCGRGGLGIIERYKDWEAGRGRIKNGGSGYKQWYYGRGREKAVIFLFISCNCCQPSVY